MSVSADDRRRAFTHAVLYGSVSGTAAVVLAVSIEQGVFGLWLIILPFVSLCLAVFAFPFVLVAGLIALCVERRIPAGTGILAFILLGGTLGAVLSVLPILADFERVPPWAVVLGGLISGLTEASIWWRMVRAKEFVDA